MLGNCKKTSGEDEMGNNIEGLDMEESAWVCRFMMACGRGEKFTERAPSEAAAEHVLKTFEDMGY